MISYLTPFGFSEQKLKLKEMNALMIIFLLALSVTFQGWLSHAKNSPDKMNSFPPPIFNDHFGSSVYREVIGNVYPLGYYSVKLNIGSPPNLFDLDIDTGSDLTWVQCELFDAPCTGCTKPRDELYKPKKENFVHCSDPLCAAVNWPEDPICESPDDRCGYHIEYADGASSHGMLVTDVFPIDLINGSLFRVRLALGCGYDQHNPGPHPPPDTAGILGLGRGRISILSQLGAIGLINNVTGLCLSGKGGGFLFLGDGFVPYSGISWTQMYPNPYEKHYEMGPAELLFGGKSFGLTDLKLIFDSGSTYTYFTERIYKKIVDLILEDVQLERAREDTTLPICWRGPFASIRDVKKYFKTLALIFTKPKRVKLYLPPKAYLIISEDKNVCLGIMNLEGAEVEQDINIIGDIFMQDKMVIFDYDKERIGWVSSNCNVGFKPLSHSL